MRGRRLLGKAQMPRAARHITHQRTATPVTGPLLVERLLADPVTSAVIAQVLGLAVRTQVAVSHGRPTYLTPLARAFRPRLA